ncbi:MAG: TetR/AcrR family transcriptional regulator [Taibaiella sp.]|jgi:AcrR family transcriptional regulator
MTKAEKTKQFIIEQTAPIFNKKGYAGTSLNDITQATGLTKGSIYGNFGGKDEVALAVFDYNLKKVTTIFEAEMSTCNTAREKLMVYVKVYSEFQNFAFPAGGCPMQNTAIEADDTHPQLKKKALTAVLNWKKAIAGIIEQGIKTGEIRRAVNAEQVALTIIATIEGMTMIANLTGKTNYRKLIIQSIEKMITDLF